MKRVLSLLILLLLSRSEAALTWMPAAGPTTGTQNSMPQVQIFPGSSDAIAVWASGFAGGSIRSAILTFPLTTWTSTGIAIPANNDTDPQLVVFPGEQAITIANAQILNTIESAYFASSTWIARNNVLPLAFL